MSQDDIFPAKPGVLTDIDFTKPTIDPAWVRADGQASSHLVWTQSQGVMSGQHSTTADTGTTIHALMLPIDVGATPPYTIETFMETHGVHDDPHAMGGLIFADGVTPTVGKEQYYMVWQTNSGFSWAVGQRDFEGYDGESGAGNPASYHYGLCGEGMYLRFEWSAANTWIASWSMDGVSYIDYQRSRTMTPTHIGITCGNWGYATPAINTYKYFRTYATSDPHYDRDTL